MHLRHTPRILCAILCLTLIACGTQSTPTPFRGQETSPTKEATPTVTATATPPPTTVIAPTATDTATTTPTQTLATTAGTAPVPTPVTLPTTEPFASTTPDTVDYGTVTGIGDSIMLGAETFLTNAISTINFDAVVGRQPAEGIAALRAHLKKGDVGDRLIIGLGTNGMFTEDQIGEIMGLVGTRRVIFINNKVPRDWESPNNTTIANAIARFPRTSLVDWYSATTDQPDLFAPDMIHPTSAGLRLYTALVVDALKKLPQ